MDNGLNFDFTDPQTLTRLLGLVIPLLVGIIAKKVASQGLKAALNALLSAIGGSLTYLVAVDGHLMFGGFINAVLNTYIVSIASYYGVWKPTGVAGTVAEKTSSFGVGTQPVVETDDKGAEDPADAAGTPIDASDATVDAAEVPPATPTGTHNAPGDDLSGD